MKFLITSSLNQNFVALSNELDKFLAMQIGERQSHYTSLNLLGDIQLAVVCFDGEKAVGCGAMRKYQKEIGETKRVYVKPEYREHGVGKEILSILEKKARENGYQQLYVETGKQLEQAIFFYQKAGYELVPAYGPYRLLENSVCLGKTLNK